MSPVKLREAKKVKDGVENNTIYFYFETVPSFV